MLLYSFNIYFFKVVYAGNLNSCVSFVLFCFSLPRTQYSQLPLRQTRSGPVPTVYLREVSALEEDGFND